MPLDQPMNVNAEFALLGTTASVAAWNVEEEFHYLYATTIATKLNERIRAYGGGRLVPSLTVLTQLIFHDTFTRELHELRKGARGYADFDDKLDTIARLFVALLTTNKNVAVHAETQWGKTITMVMTALLLRAYHAENNIDQQIVIWCPTRTATSDATRTDLSAASQLHRCLTFGRRPLNADCNSMIKVVTKSKRDVQAFLKEIRGASICFFDEADEASSKDSVIGKLLDDPRSTSARLVLVSATAYVYGELENVEHIHVKIDKDSGYSGTVAGIRTPIMSVEEYAALHQAAYPDLKNLPSLTPAAFKAAKSKKSFVKAFLALIYSQIERTGTGKHGPFDGGRGALLRFGTSAEMLPLLDAVEPVLNKRGVGIIRHFGKNARVEISTAVAQCEFRYCIVAVTGAARRADRLPSSITHGYDFTEEFTTMPALEQGTLGRLSGYGKITATQSTLCLLQKRNAEAVRLFRMIYDHIGRKVPVKRVENGAIRIDDARFCYRSRIGISLARLNVTHKEKINDWVRDRIIPYISLKQTTSNVGAKTMAIHRDKTKLLHRAEQEHLARGIGVMQDPDTKAVRFTFDLFEVLPQTMIDDVLRDQGFGPEAKVSVEKDGKGRVPLGFGRVDRGSTKNGLAVASGGRMVDGNYGRGDRKLYPEIMFEWSNGQFHPIMIILPLNGKHMGMPRRDPSKPGILPGDGSMFGRLRTARETAMVETLEERVLDLLEDADA